jgi:predicted nucleic acid-binding protein
VIVLDTNVVFEVMKPSPSAAVLDWLNRQSSARLHLSCVKIAAIAKVNGGAVATRNIGHFEHCGVELINPFGDERIGKQ